MQGQKLKTAGLAHDLYGITALMVISWFAVATDARAQTANTWTGGGTDANWGTSANWNNGVPTTSGVWALIFSGATRTNNTDNIGGASDTVTVSSLAFSNSTTLFTLGRADSRTLTLTDGATVSTVSGGSSGVKDIINIPLALGGSATFNTAGHDLQLGGVVSGGTLIKTGSTVLYFNATPTTSNFVVNAGQFYPAGCPISGTVTFNGGTTFVGGNGNQPLTFSFLQGATVRPYTGATTIFTSPTFNRPTNAAANVTVNLTTATGTNPTEIQGTIQDNLAAKTVSLANNSSGGRWKLSGSNTHSGATTLTAGTLILANQNAAQNSTVTMSGGINVFDSSVSGNAFTFGGLAATSSGAGYDIALTNSAGNAVALTVGGNNADTTYAGVLSGGGSLAKTGAGTLILSGGNSFSGATTVKNGVVQYNSSGAVGGTSGITVSNGAAVAFNYAAIQSSVDKISSGSSGAVAVTSSSAAENVDLSASALAGVYLGAAGSVTYTGTLTKNGSTVRLGGGSGTLTLAGANVGLNNNDATALSIGGNVVLTGANNFTGGTTVNAGTLKMGNPAALGASNSTVSVASGAALDVNGQVMTAANPYVLTLNGSGVSGGGALRNSSSTAAAYCGNVTLAGDSTIRAAGGSLGLNNDITGSYVLTMDASQSIIISGTVNVGGVIKTGGASAEFSKQNVVGTLGPIQIKNGYLILRGTVGAGPITLGDTTGANNTILQLATGVMISTPITVAGGNTGIATIDNYSNWSPVLSGTLTLNKSVTLRNTSSSGANWTVSGPIVGSGGLTILNSGGNLASSITLSGTNTYSGVTVVTNSTLKLTHAQCMPTNTTVYLYTGATNNLAFTGTSTIRMLYVDGVLQEARRVYGAHNRSPVLSGSGYYYTTEGTPPHGTMVSFF